MSEHKVGEHTYRIGRLNARRQLQVVRRIAPVFAESAPLIAGVLTRVRAGEQISIETAVAQFGPAITALKNMNDADVDLVVTDCLSVVDRQMQGGLGWAAMTAPNGSLMFQNLGWMETLQLVWLVVQENLLTFFPAGRPTSSVAAQ